MSTVVYLPRTLVYLNEANGAALFWDRRMGLLYRSAPPRRRWCRMTANQLRRHPVAHRAWLEFARYLPASEAAMAAGGGSSRLSV